MIPSGDFPSLVDTDWLRHRLGDQSLRILDASWHLPGTGRDGLAEYRDAHVPGARFLDIDRVADVDSDLPHMLPDAEYFAAEMASLGVGNDSRVVVYDTHGLFGAARGWWMLRVFGHDRVAILDGGLTAWRAAGLPLASGENPAPSGTRFEAGFRPQMVRDLQQVRANLDTRTERLIDARPAGRFAGEQPEPRAGLRGGHVPGAENIPFDRLIDPETRRVRAPEALRDLFGQSDRRPVVCSCGTGVTACALAFGLYRIDREDVAVYDGSWTEWGGRDDTPVATGYSQDNEG